MSFTYDPTNDVGRVRRTIPDKDGSDYFWSDEEIESFITDEGDWRRATALALETMASNDAYVLKVVSVQNIRTDGAAVARALMQRAGLLREQAAVADGEGSFATAEVIVNEFQWREFMAHELIKEA